MKATEAKILDFIKKSPQFVIPIYQRNYSWEEQECRQLWNDIIRSGSNDAISAHFIGSIVYVEKGLYHVTSQSPLLVIDGQQRLTTISLLLAALEKIIIGEPIEGFNSRKIHNYYLVNREEEGELHYKLLLSQTDKSTLLHIIGGPPPAEESVRIIKNYHLFQKLLQEQQGNLVPICKGLAKLVIVDISLNRDQDNPQLIFESMNSTGQPLGQADLIRNFILMGLDVTLQTSLYERYWRPMECAFGQDAYRRDFNGFMRYYLTLKTGEIPLVDKVYSAFKNYARRPDVAALGVEALVQELLTYAHYFCALALNAEKDSELADAFLDLRDLKVDVAFPLLLELYHDYSTGELSREDFLQAVRYIESFVFRRAACDIPPNSLNKIFANFSRTLKKDRYMESFKATLLLLPSYRRFPSDDEFKQGLQKRDFYNTRLRSYWPHRMENHDRKERVRRDKLSIEHILPQNENLSPQWQTELGPEWRRIQKTWLHTLGNLTLTGYNSEYSDKTFREKRDMEGGFSDSPLRLNKGLGTLEYWNEKTIQARATRLADEATKVWPIPFLAEDVLNGYRAKNRTSNYTLEEHHHHLLVSPAKELFEAFRKAVMKIDPCVTEDILKLYVAYKSETNFVDVIPLAQKLRLIINMRFHEIYDPENLCRDVTGLRRWGNGDVEIHLSHLNELPYIMTLVQQAFDKQTNNAEEQ
jgi:uncharacterized protein with ParB-like and HNH nuclease domain/predicted transport protein